MKLFISGFLVLLSLCVIGQDKVEKEFRVKKKDVPAEAKKWFKDAFEGAGKVNWYYEESSDKGSYEAKLKYRGLEYSVEFDTTGKIEDIEVRQEWEDLPHETKDNINNYFLSNYIKYKVLKIQKQYTGSPDNLEDLIDEDETEGITVRYEIEFHGKTEKENELWEGLFSSNGSLLKVRKIKMMPTNNLEF